MFSPGSSNLRGLLAARNEALADEVTGLRDAILGARVPAPLEPFRQRLEQICVQCAALTTENHAHLHSKNDDILEEVRSNIQQVTRSARLIGGVLAIPVLRASDTDSLCLNVIAWVHAAHTETAQIPAASGDGSIAIFPYTPAPIYYYPCLERRRLLFLALHFHEFGHLLYKLHQAEMDDIVRDLQLRIEDDLRPRSRRNDQHAARQAARLRSVVGAWYAWAQELFCDAAGLTLGGPAFMHAFGSYLSELRHADFHQPEDLLQRSTHPVTWLRVQFLARRAHRLGHIQAAQLVRDEWALVAQSLGVQEDHHGFYVDSLESAVDSAIDDMLTEAGPRAALAEEVVPNRDWQPGDSPVLLLNRAWQVVERDRAGYSRWEEAAIAMVISST
ncbi:MAG: hypothetical protein KGJ62_01485 [Armatimonadetes bacterium]|nr:hypothetical protein [Armatimonadota bacterium]MDE2205824.1 hypothetical protein [Armatimonadota bacterium]